VGEIAATVAVTLPRTATLDDAAGLMAEHETAHVVIVNEASGDPLGIVSTLDVAPLARRTRPQSARCVATSSRWTPAGGSR
jgi:CBS domain-containing protein